MALEDRYVFAHFVLGNSTPMVLDDWKDDIQRAQAMSIDGFGLNIARLDPNNDNNLHNAFRAAEELGSGFKLYFNFDYLAWGTWEAAAVIEKINQYKQSPAYFMYQGRAFVSTFEGTGNVQDWPSIRNATGCFFVPDWSSMGAVGAGQHLGTAADGLASWNAWPEGPNELTTGDDELYLSVLGGRPYMMPVSPWFFTNLPNYGKNWLWRSDDLWHRRWEQVIRLSSRAQFVQIITWNDYGESHYIGPVRPACRPPGSEWYVQEIDHQGWGNLLPRYISAYKSGRIQNLKLPPSATEQYQEKLTYWYRANPGHCGSANGTVGNNPNYQSTYPPHVIAEDKVFLTVLLHRPANITVRIGQAPPTVLQTATPGMHHFSVPFNGRTGPVHFEVSRNEGVALTTVGPEITTNCPGGNVNWNPVVGSV